MALPTQTTQTTHFHPWYPATHLLPHHASTHLHPYYPSARPRPRLPANPNNASDLRSLIDQHLAWQDDAIRPGTRGTLLVDWDGSGEPYLSYRGGAGEDGGDLTADLGDEEGCGGCEGSERLLGYRCEDGEAGEDDEVCGILGHEEEERGVREVLEEMLGEMKMVGEEHGKEMEEREVSTRFLIRRKPVPGRRSGPGRLSVPMGLEGQEGKKDLGVDGDKAVPEVDKRLPEVSAEEQMERMPIFYRYEQVSGEREEIKREAEDREVKKKENRGSVGRLAEVLKEEGLEVWGMLKYEGKELMAIMRYEGKELFEEVKEDGKELLDSWREEGRWLSVVLRNEWRDGRVVIGKGIKKVVCYV
ncbi:hypothetical protein J3E71DRAFT_337584 [Bipolaris maydis]|nr:hypothetical protein J3E71DRAFT_337584 [Bipolaris maydis]